MPSPYAEIADVLKTIIDAEFAPEGWSAIHDNLHPAVGAEGTRIGIAMDEEAPRVGNIVQQDTAITVKFYRRWDPDVDPSKKVDPRLIAEFGERFRNALRNYQHAGSNKVWFFQLVRIRYPNDPVGNKTRFEADIVAHGSNSAVVETSG